MEQVVAAWEAYWRALKHLSGTPKRPYAPLTYVAPGWRARVVLARLGGLNPFPAFGPFWVCRWGLLRTAVRKLRADQ